MNIGEIVTVVTYEPIESANSEPAPVEEMRQEEELVPSN